MEAAAPIRVLIYCRCSTEEQAKEGVSLAAQQAKIEAFCRLYSLTVVGSFEDAGFSGKDLNRPGIQAVLTKLNAKEADGVVVLNLLRLTRSPADWESLLPLFTDKGGKVLYSVENLVETRTAMGRFVLRLHVLLGALERETTIERTVAALNHKKQNGERVGSVRFGFKLADDGKSLVEVPEQQQAISLMRALKTDGWSLRRIAAELDKQEFRSQSGRPWSVSAVNRILKRTD